MGFQPVTKTKRRWPIALVALAVIGVGLYIHTAHATSRTASKSTAAVTTKQQVSLTDQLTSITASDSEATFSVAVINLASGASYHFGTTNSYTAASTTKIITAAAFLHEVEAGKASLSESVGDETAAWQLQEMVQDSNNDSWVLLNTAVGGANLQTYARGLGLSSFNYEDNTLTAADDATLLKLLYQGKLLNTADTNLVLSYMQNTNDQTLIPAALPAGVTVYQKYGELDNTVHDGAIIEDGSAKFVLVIYSNSTEVVDYAARTAIIHQITAAVLAAETI
jgi:beta-lactamase class A